MPSPQPDAGGHYFAHRPRAASSRRTVQYVLPEGHVIVLETDRGMFSPERVDHGTRALLADGPKVVGHGTVVDLGCGYGPIAIALARRSSPAVSIWAVDVNERARDLCRANAQRNEVADRIRVVAPEEVPDDLVVDQLWSNPPIRIGKANLHTLLLSWLARLRPGTGSAEVVVHRHLGSDSLSRWLAEEGYQTTRVSSHSGYRVLHIPAKP